MQRKLCKIIHLHCIVQRFHSRHFSSSLKYGSVTFSDGTYLLGAPEFIMHEDFARIEEEIIPYADKGDRVLLLQGMMEKTWRMA